MRGIKIGAVFAVCGFLLSFVSGLFSHTSFLSILLKAIIFALCFGILGFLIHIIYSKFLGGESSGDLGSDISSESPKASVKQNTTGHLVDITIQDEDLEKSTSDNHFVLNESHQMLNESDLEHKANGDSTEKTAENGFVPLKNLETLKTLTGKEAVHPDSAVVPVESVIKSSNSKSDGLDVLPDMNSLSLESENDSSTDEEDVETDNEFVSSAQVIKHNDEPTEIKDASLMAKAISSILSGEDS